jgi:hypothetical protein
VGFVVEKVALEQVFFEYFGFPCQSSFHQLLHNHHHLSSGDGKIGHRPAEAAVPSELSLTPLRIIKKNTSITAVLLPFVTYLLTFPRTK